MRSRVAVVAMAATLAIIAGGCGAARPSVPRRAAAVYGGPAPLLVYFKRVIGFDPLASDLVVDRDGSAVATITLGGVNGQKRKAFTLAPTDSERCDGSSPPPASRIPHAATTPATTCTWSRSAVIPGAWSSGESHISSDA